MNRNGANTKALRQRIRQEKGDVMFVLVVVSYLRKNGMLAAGRSRSDPMWRCAGEWRLIQLLGCRAIDVNL